jgi:hypothetical protein
LAPHDFSLLQLRYSFPVVSEQGEEGAFSAGALIQRFVDELKWLSAEGNFGSLLAHRSQVHLLWRICNTSMFLCFPLVYAYSSRASAPCIVPNKQIFYFFLFFNPIRVLLFSLIFSRILFICTFFLFVYDQFDASEDESAGCASHSSAQLGMFDFSVLSGGDDTNDADADAEDDGEVMQTDPSDPSGKVRLINTHES